MRSGMLVMRPDTISTRTEFLKTLWLGDVVCGGISADLLSKRPAALGLRQASSTRVVPPEFRVVEPEAGSYIHSTCSDSYCRWLCVYAERRGAKWHHVVPLSLHG